MRISKTGIVLQVKATDIFPSSFLTYNVKVMRDCKSSTVTHYCTKLQFCVPGRFKKMLLLHNFLSLLHKGARERW